jgi:hypothetical protein
MSEEANPEQDLGQPSTSSGLLLSVQSLAGGGPLSATAADTSDTDSDTQDTSDAGGGDTDGTDESDTDGSDAGGGDSDGSDGLLGGDSDSSDDTGANIKADADSTDS